MKMLKFATGDEGIFQSSEHEPLFDKILDDTTPQSRSDLVSQAFLTNMAMGDPTLEASPPAVNPILTGPLRGAGRVDGAQGTTSTENSTDTHDVFAAYDAGRFDAWQKYAQMNLPAGTLKSTAAAQTPKPTTVATRQAAATPTVTPTTQAIQGQAAQVPENSPLASPQDFTGNARTAVPAPGPAIQQGPKSGDVFPHAQVPGQKGASLEVRDGYGKKEPSRYSIPADNGADYSPLTNKDDKTPKREVNKAFNDLAVQRNADSLNEMGQASIGTIG